MTEGLSRRALLRRGAVLGGAAVAAGTVVGGCRAEGGEARSSPPSGGALAAPTGTRLPFHGPHQAGIVTPAPAAGVVAVFDVVAADRAALATALQDLTTVARRLVAGEAAAPLDPLKPPPDNLILGPAPQADALTITVGLGASLFDDRYGLAGRRPVQLVEMPAFPNDQLAPERSHGDLVVQICGGSNETCIHALRRLMRATRDSMVVRWMVPGFNQPNTLGPGRSSTRNLLGFKDGTANLDAADTALMDELVWVRAGGRRAGVDGGRQLPRGPHHPHAGGVLGPDAAAHAGDDHRAPQGHRRTARPDGRDRHPGLRRRPRRRAVPARRAHPPGQPPHARHETATGSCAAASPTRWASTRPGTSTRACCSSASSATWTRGSSRSRTG